MESKGHLNPGASGVSFDRFKIGFPDLVGHVWLIRWSIPEGEVSPQRVLTYPTLNVVFMRHGATLHGPERKVVTQNLRGKDWVVGIKLRPAATPWLSTTNPADLMGSVEQIVNSPHADIVQAMEQESNNEAIVAILHEWLKPFDEQVDDEGRTMNSVGDLIEQRTDITNAYDIANLIPLSKRSLERMVKRYTGMTLKWLIECRRMQHAATTIYAKPSTDLSQLASELGFADHAHFTRRYTEVIGETPSATRAASPLWKREAGL